MRQQRFVPTQRHMGFFVQLVKCLPVPQTATIFKVSAFEVEGYGVWLVSLQLDSIGSGYFRFLNDAHGGFEFTVVIGRDLCNHMGGGSLTRWDNLLFEFFSFMNIFFYCN